MSPTPAPVPSTKPATPVSAPVTAPVTTPTTAVAATNAPAAVAATNAPAAVAAINPPAPTAAVSAGPGLPSASATPSTSVSFFNDSVTAGGATKSVNMAVPQADRFDGGQTGGHTVAGGTGRDLFVLHAGVSDGDVISNFQANTASGDILQLTGCGAGATFTQVDTTTWTASFASGAVHNTIHFGNSATPVPANVVLA